MENMEVLENAGNLTYIYMVLEFVNSILFGFLIINIYVTCKKYMLQIKEAC